MTFLNPAALWGLLALLVPIIVHFFNLQRPRQVLFSNVAFVREVKRTVVRRLNFQRWLLLLLRLLALAAIVLMFANPVQLRDGQQLLQGSRSVAIVVDNSQSMNASNERGEYFRQAISLSRNLIKAYGQEDEFLVTSTADLSVQAGFTGKEEILDQLEKLTIEQNTRSFGEILSLAPRMFDRSSGSIRELYLISDFQESTVLNDSLEATLSDSTLRVHLLPLASRQPSNVFVEDHSITSRILAPDKPATMNLTLVNDGTAPVQELSVRVILEGKVAAISTHSLEAGEKKPVEINFLPESSGWLSGHIELDDQPIDFDNRRYFSFYVPGKERLLVVESQPSPNVRVLFEQVFDQFDVTIVNDRSLANVNFNDFQAIIWSGISRFSSGLIDQLSSFVTAGGNLMVFPGADLDQNSWNQWLQAMRIGSINPVVSVEEGIECRSYDLQHPVFDGVFASRQSGNQSQPDPIRVFRYYPLNLSGAVAQSRIIQMENQLPFLLESKKDEGRVFLFSVFPGNQWSDFQVKAIFAPLIFRMAQLMSQSGRVSMDQEIGDFSPMAVKASSQDRIDLRNEGGEIFTPERYDRGGESRLVFERMKLAAGNYEVIQNDSVLAAISFNITDQESALAYADGDRLEEVVGTDALRGQVDILPPSAENVATQIQTSREGWPLWRWFLWIALIGLLIEAFVLGAGSGFSFRKPSTTAN